MYAIADIVGYILGFILYNASTLKDGIFRSFLLAIGVILGVLIYICGFGGENYIILGILMLFCKVFISSAMYLGYLGIFLVFKPRI